MFDSQPTEKELLKTILEPLLEDFVYWFSRSRTLLESGRLEFLDSEEQEELLERVKQAQQEVATTRLLFDATDGQVGIESRILLPWHRLVGDCWRVASRARALKTGETSEPDNRS